MANEPEDSRRPSLPDLPHNDEITGAARPVPNELSNSRIELAAADFSHSVNEWLIEQDYSFVGPEK